MQVQCIDIYASSLKVLKTARLPLSVCSVNALLLTGEEFQTGSRYTGNEYDQQLEDQSSTTTTPSG